MERTASSMPLLGGSLHLRQGMLLFVTGATRWKILLFRAQIDRRTSEGGDTINVLQVRDRFTIAEGAGRLYLLDRVGQLEGPPRAFELFFIHVGGAIDLKHQ
jgi:hypothetical protein